MLAAEQPRMQKIFAYLVPVSLAAACTHSSDDQGLAAARARWADHAPGAYRFVWARSCECIPEVSRPIEVTVTGGQISGAVYADDRSGVAGKYLGSVRTVDEVFDD